MHQKAMANTQQVAESITIPSKRHIIKSEKNIFFINIRLLNSRPNVHKALATSAFIKSLKGQSTIHNIYIRFLRIKEIMSEYFI